MLTFQLWHRLWYDSVRHNTSGQYLLYPFDIQLIELKSHNSGCNDLISLYLLLILFEQTPISTIWLWLLLENWLNIFKRSFSFSQWAHTMNVIAMYSLIENEYTQVGKTAQIYEFFCWERPPNFDQFPDHYLTKRNNNKKESGDEIR